MKVTQMVSDENFKFYPLCGNIGDLIILILIVPIKQVKEIQMQ